jgi:hypothetical protein
MDELIRSKRRFEAYIKDLPNAKDWEREFRYLFTSIFLGETAFIREEQKVKAAVDEIITGDGTDLLMEIFNYCQIEKFKLMITRREAFLNIDLDRVFSQIINVEHDIVCEVLMKKILVKEIQRLLAP